MANPSGPVHAAAYDEPTRRIVEAALGCDAILLDLHGAMVAENSADGEGDLLARVRAAAPNVPLGVALDLHGNITEQMVQNADVMVGFKTYPHIDMYETGEHAGRLLLQMLRGEASYRVLAPAAADDLTLRSTTLEAPCAMPSMPHASWNTGLPAVTVFAGFSLADIEAPCMTVVATCREGGSGRNPGCRGRPGTTDLAAPRRLCLTAAKRWPIRCAAPQPGPGCHAPVLLLTMATTARPAAPATPWTCCRAALAQGLTGIAVGPICDPETVATLIKAGVAPRWRSPGNKVPLAQLGRTKPLQLRGRGACGQRWRLHRNRPDLHRPTLPHGPPGMPGHRQRTDRGHRAAARAPGSGRIPLRGRGSTRFRYLLLRRACTAGRCSCRCPPAWWNATAQASPPRTMRASPSRMCIVPSIRSTALNKLRIWTGLRHIKRMSSRQLAVAMVRPSWTPGGLQ